MSNFLTAFITLITGLIGILGTGAIGYLLNRIRKLERDSDQREEKDLRERDAKIGALNETISKMTFRLSELEKQAARVPVLEQQVDTLCKELMDVREVQKAAEDTAKAARDENGLLRSTNDHLTEELKTAQQRIHDLETEHGLYDRILDRIGVERKAKPDVAPEPGEAPAPVVEEPKV